MFANPRTFPMVCAYLSGILGKLRQSAEQPFSHIASPVRWKVPESWLLWWVSCEKAVKWDQTHKINIFFWRMKSM